MEDPISWIAAKAAEWVAMTAFQAATATGVSITTAATIANVAYAATYALVYVGAAVGLSSLMSPKVPNAEQGKVPVNQTTPKRRIGTGRARLSGPRALWESLPGWNVEIINVLDQPVDAFEQFWLNDDAVTVDTEGWVQRLNGAYGDHEIRILAKTGQPGDDGAFDELIALFASAGLSDLYDESHVGEGVARMALLCKAIDDRYVMDVYRPSRSRRVDPARRQRRRPERAGYLTLCRAGPLRRRGRADVSGAGQCAAQPQRRIARAGAAVAGVRRSDQLSQSGPV
ncbi:hypothetical protein [Brevundimonas intermedia]|uniref:hypothetical protein n=1 Tax=Brevundimonas intermedia TaxID=74315 RepID=UPI0032AEFBE5